MPNRILKESINESRSLNDCTFFAQDLFKRLITYADDYGRFNADTEIMRARLYPRDLDIVSQDDVVEALIELCGANKIQFYTAKISNNHGNKDVYGAFPNWRAHQRVRDSKERFPEPDDTWINDWYLRRFIPVDMKAEIIERDEFKCQICGKDVGICKDAKRFVKMATGLYHIDHIVPVSQGGRATFENLRLTCPKCNLKRKRKFTFDEILAETRGESLQNSCLSDNSPQLAATRRELRPESNPIQSESNPNPNPNPEAESESRRAPKPAAAVADHVDVGTVEVYLANNITGLNATLMQEFVSFKDDLPEELIRYAIDEACAQNVRSYGYLRKILNRYVEQGFKTIGDVKADKAAFERNKQAKASPSKHNYQQHEYTDSDFGDDFFYDPSKDYGGRE